MYKERIDFRVGCQGREKNLHNKDATMASQAYHTLSCWKVVLPYRKVKTYGNG